MISDNIIVGNGQAGVNLSGSDINLVNNTIAEHYSGYGVLVPPTTIIRVKGNIIKYNGLGLSYQFSTTNAHALITNNEIADNSSHDIDVTETGAHISFNIFDTIFNGRDAKGQYNAKSDGSVASLR